jgi:hypothetical protein
MLNWLFKPDAVDPFKDAPGVQWCHSLFSKRGDPLREFNDSDVLNAEEPIHRITVMKANVRVLL